ncbi:hypothetical protein VZT92_026182 [Zoarces viviparus]|uniref:Uncharacterized protein n=1 Tax=Zoarces viviparus TaxID=48416 RepID=A0AAW1DZA0_ZOAVI
MNRRSFASRWHLLVDISDIKAAETDLIKLKLQYRRAEGAKRAHREETQGLLSRQTNFEVFIDIKALVCNNQDSNHRKVKHKQLESKELARGDFEDAVRKILVETKEMDLDKQELYPSSKRQLGNIWQLINSALRSLKSSWTSSKKSGSSDGVQDENVVEYLRRVDNRVKELLTLQAFIHFQQNLNPWDIQSPYDCWAAPGKELTSCQSHHCCWDCFTCVGVIVFCAGRDMMLKDQCDDPDGVELLLLEEKEPLSRDDLQKRIQRRRKTDRLT